MKRNLFFTILLTLVFLISGVTSGQAQEIDTSGVTDNDVNAIAKQLYCPVCENIPLDVCGTQACADWREEIRVRLAEGWTEDQIKQYFVDRFGDRVLATPPASGLNWLVYIVPPTAFIAGVIILIRGIQSWRAGTASDEEEAIPTAISDDPYIAQLEDALKKK